MRKDCSEPSRSCQDPLTICRVLTTCSCQVQHVLREGQQDLCHLQGGEETAALHPAGHRVVCGRVSMPWPSEGTPGGGDVACTGFCRETPLGWSFHSAGTCARRRGLQAPWEGERSLGKAGWGGWMLAGFTTNSNSAIATFYSSSYPTPGPSLLGVESLGLHSLCQGRLPCITVSPVGH